jgi:biopolymer transport protein ExbB
MSNLFTHISDLMSRGGWVMWPLLALSALAVTLIVERCWFWIATNRPGRATHVQRMSDKLRRGDFAGARELALRNDSVYSRAVMHIMVETSDQPAATRSIDDALAAEVLEAQRPRLERFMATLSTIITAAPLLGILGTVTGIIASFDLLSQQTVNTDPRAVSGGIAEALLTTAAGLTVAIVVLFPYNAFRAQIDRTLGRLETLVAAAARKRDQQISKSGD